jgi:hypothetical protein
MFQKEGYIYTHLYTSGWLTEDFIPSPQIDIWTFTHLLWRATLQLGKLVEAALR